jgi:uncharacterized lipoprotein YmbA
VLSASGGWARTVEVRRVGLAGYLDRPDVVRGVGGYRVQVAADERWSEPLGDMIGRVLVENLRGRLSGARVFNEGGAVAMPADAVVEVDIDRFEKRPDGTVVLSAELAIARVGSDAPPETVHLVLETRPAGTSTAALAAAMSELLARVADRSAAMLSAPPVASR